MKRIRIMSGEFKGPYLGQNFSGLRTNPELLKTPEEPILGTAYSMYAQEDAAHWFIEEKRLKHPVGKSGNSE